MGEAYRPNLDSIAAVKESVDSITPFLIYEHQAKSEEVSQILQGKHSPRNKFKFISYKGQKLLCEVSQSIRPFIPKSLIPSILKTFHSFDHAGQKECQFRISSNYFWPKLKKDVSYYVKRCHACQSAKPALKINPKSRTFKVPEERFRQLHTDIVGPLPESEGMRYMLTILCRRSHWLEVVPLPAATSINVCNGFIRPWLSRFGAPQEIFCDNGNTYVANLWKDLNRVLGIEVTFVPPYHQATNGAIERQHRTLKESIKASLIEMEDTHRENWMKQLPFTLLGRRVALQPDLGTSAAELTLGGSPVLPRVVVPDLDSSEIKTNHELLKTLQTKASSPTVPMSRHSGPPTVYEPADFHKATHVYIKIDNPNNLGQKWQGPFIIVDRPTNTTVTIRVGYNKERFPRLECHH